MDFKVILKYENKDYVKISDVLQFNKIIGKTKKALKEYLYKISLIIKGFGRAKWVLLSNVKVLIKTDENTTTDNEKSNNGFSWEEWNKTTENLNEEFKQWQETFARQASNIIPTTLYTNDEKSLIKKFRNVLITKFHPDVNKESNGSEIDLINKVFNNIL